MANGKGSLRRPLGQISDEYLAAEWRRIFGGPVPPNKQVVVNKLIEHEEANPAAPEPSEAERVAAFQAQERANLARYDSGVVLDAPRAEQMAHESGCECRVCRPDLILKPWGQAHIEATPDQPRCEACGEDCAEGESLCSACAEEADGEITAASPEPVAERPLAPVTPDVPRQSPVAEDRATRRQRHRGR